MTSRPYAKNYESAKNTTTRRLKTRLIIWQSILNISTCFRNKSCYTERWSNDPGIDWNEAHQVRVLRYTPIEESLAIVVVSVILRVIKCNQRPPLIRHRAIVPYLAIIFEITPFERFSDPIYKYTPKKRRASLANAYTSLARGGSDGNHRVTFVIPMLPLSEGAFD